MAFFEVNLHQLVFGSFFLACLYRQDPEHDHERVKKVAEVPAQFSSVEILRDVVGAEQLHSHHGEYEDYDRYWRQKSTNLLQTWLSWTASPRLDSCCYLLESETGSQFR